MSDGPALVVLAAGASVRLGEPKALARLRPGAGGSALALLVAAGARIGDARPLVVTGPDHEAITALLPAHIEVAHNEHWSAGRTGSIQLALARRPGRDLCLAPIDVPLVPGAVFAALGDAWARAGRPPRGWLAPSVRRAGQVRFGHPVIVGRELARELKEFPPERPLSALRGRAEPLFDVPVDDDAVLDDLDTPADLRTLRDRTTQD